jgi:hypothetical protein
MIQQQLTGKPQSEKKPPAQLRGGFLGGVQRLLLLLRCRFKRQLHVAQVTLGLYQYQGRVVDDHSGWALAGNVHRLGLGSDLGLHGCYLLGVGIDPL